MYNGIIIVDKPQEFTSHDVIAKLRGILSMRKIGHSGTLDPMATGILPIFLGNATRAVDFHADKQKEYVATFKFGIKTDTEDIWGKIVEKQDIFITKEQVLSVLAEFKGKILQIPPMYSAIKINGQKLYDIARNGGTVERKPREIEIFEIELIEDDNLQPCEYKIRVLCSKGTYIRTICTDIAKKLGTIATMTSLVRTKSGEYSKGYTLEQLQQLKDSGEICNIILPTDSVFYDKIKVNVNKNGYTRLKNGTFARYCDVTYANLPLDTEVLVYFENNFFMLGKTGKLYDGDFAIFPQKAFF